jgi:hypothetical protein
MSKHTTAVTKSLFPGGRKHQTYDDYQKMKECTEPDQFEGGQPQDKPIHHFKYQNMEPDSELKETIATLCKNETDWVSSLNSAKMGPKWNNAINLELFEGQHSHGKKHLFMKKNGGGYELDGDEILGVYKAKTHEQMKDMINSIGDWQRWYGVCVVLKSRLTKVFSFRLNTVTDKQPMKEPRAQGYMVLAWAAEFDWGDDFTFTSKKEDDKICGCTIKQGNALTIFKNEYEGKQPDSEVMYHLRHRNLIATVAKEPEKKLDQVIVEVRLSEWFGYNFPGKDTYQFMK